MVHESVLEGSEVCLVPLLAMVAELNEEQNDRCLGQKGAHGHIEIEGVCAFGKETRRGRRRLMRLKSEATSSSAISTGASDR
jgi:hypothetical protein